MLRCTLPDLYTKSRAVLLRVCVAFFKIEHGYFGSIGSGVKFQFFGAHFTSTSRISMRVGAFDSSTLPLCEKNMELACGTSNFFLGHES